LLPTTELDGPGIPTDAAAIYDPPVMLYVRGDSEVLNLYCWHAAQPTLYGTQMAERLGRELAARGLVVGSGMARGIDAIGHQGPLASNGRRSGSRDGRGGLLSEGEQKAV
jgi:DNA processing protein